MYSKNISLAAILLLSTVSIANGDELNPRMDPVWNFKYVGVSLGYTNHRARFADPEYDWYGSTHEYYSDGLGYGAQFGQNWQSNALVYGYEADFFGFTNDRDTIFASDDLVNNELNWMATLRGRVGLGVGQTYLYYTGGLAIADIDRSWLEANDPTDSWPNLGDTKVGGVVGFGLERILNNGWTARVEARKALFDSNDTINGDDYVLSIEDQITSVNFSLNYILGGGAADSVGYAYGTPHNFGGWYVGGHVGGHHSTISQTDIEFDYYGSTFDHDYFGLTGGVQVGHNWQDGAQVYGVEGEFALLGGDAGYTERFGFYRVDAQTNWTASLRLKSGVAAGNTLMYLLAGVSLADIDNVFDDGANHDTGGTEVGYQVGAGLEQALHSGWTAKVETVISRYNGDAENTGGALFRSAASDIKVTAGLNYYFNQNATDAGVLEPEVNWAGMFVGGDVLFANHVGSIFDRVYYEHGGSYNLPSMGAGAGLHAGINWQDENFVYGLIGDFAFFSNERQDTTRFVYRSVESSLNWQGTLRARAGIATGRSFIYATGGLAVADVDLSYDYPGFPEDSFNLDGTRVGWTGGMGVEHAITDNSSIKLEALYANFGEASALNGDTCTDGLVTEPCEMLGYDSNITVKIGYSVKIGG